uniref:Uncharacterized protein n=1 Tax=viral metagenome TaxID=1070528 RepID=A0A6C0BYT1_9ZZZZ
MVNIKSNINNNLSQSKAYLENKATLCEGPASSLQRVQPVTIEGMVSGVVVNKSNGNSAVLDNLKDEFGRIMAIYEEKKAALESATRKYVSHIKMMNKETTTYRNNIIINNENVDNVTVYNSKDIAFLEDISGSGLPLFEKCAKVAVYYEITDTDYGKATNIKPVVDWYTQNAKEFDELPQPSNAVGLLISENKDNKWKKEFPEGPYFACNADGCTKKEAGDVCQAMGGRICTKDEMNDAFNGNMRGSNENKWSSCDSGWVLEEGNPTGPYLWASSQTQAASAAGGLLSSATSEKGGGPAGALAKLQSSTPLPSSCGSKPGENKSAATSTSGAFCCKENKKCQQFSTEIGIWKSAADEKATWTAELTGEWKGLFKKRWDNKCGDVKSIKPEFSSPDYLRAANELFALKMMDGLRENIKTPGWWDSKSEKYYPERYYVNKFGLKQKIDTSNVTAALKNAKDEKEYNSLLETLNSAGEQCNKNWIKEYVNSDDIDKLSDGGVIAPGGGCGMGGTIISSGNKYAWIDSKGTKHIFANDDVYNSRNTTSCPTMSTPVTEDVWNSFATGEPITNNDYICEYFDNILYNNVKSAYKDLKTYIGQIEKHIAGLKKEDKLLGNKLVTLQTRITKNMLEMNSNMDKIDRLRLLSDTADGKAETTGLLMSSNKIQLIVWTIIGLLLLVYSIYGIRGGFTATPLHITMLVVCTVILFTISRHIYLTGII